MARDESPAEPEYSAIEIDEAAEQSRPATPSQFKILQRPHAMQYAGYVMSAFSHVPPRLWHAKGSPVKVATFGLPEFDAQGKKLNWDHFQQTGFGIIPGKKPCQLLCVHLLHGFHQHQMQLSKRANSLHDKGTFFLGLICSNNSQSFV
jgi:hypothetical protein